MGFRPKISTQAASSIIGQVLIRAKVGSMSSSLPRPRSARKTRCSACRL